MQMSDSHAQKNSLFSAMSRFIGAVNNMDQTVLVPSLLRDVPLDERQPAADATPLLPQDMYGSYVLLKSIRNHMESSVPSADERRRDKAGGEAEDEDLEKQFHFHLNGLHAVLAKLTRRADTLTSRYQQEIGYRN